MWHFFGQSQLSLVGSLVPLAVKSEFIAPLHISLCLLQKKYEPNKWMSFISRSHFLNSVLIFFFYLVPASFQSVALSSSGKLEILANCCFNSSGAATGFQQRTKVKRSTEARGRSRLFSVLQFYCRLTLCSIFVQGHNFITRHELYKQEDKYVVFLIEIEMG